MVLTGGNVISSAGVNLTGLHSFGGLRNVHAIRKANGDDMERLDRREILLIMKSVSLARLIDAWDACHWFLEEENELQRKKNLQGTVLITHSQK